MRSGRLIDADALRVTAGLSVRAESFRSLRHLRDPIALTSVEIAWSMAYAGLASTLFVADDGDGISLGEAGKNTRFAGLQEWKLGDGMWSLFEIFQGNLIEQTYTPNGLNWQVQEDGLRNISGEVDTDGSFTLFGTTSTVSDELTHDLGADPNELVSIRIAANSTASNTFFNVLETSRHGQRCGGVAVAPIPEPEFGFVSGRGELRRTAA